ncbi:MAG: PrgI family protein [Candidatus Paceibacteria bacterium]
MDQQFVVPQYIDVENKIFGPISVRQFLILLTAAVLIFVIYQFLTFILFIIATLLVGGLAIVFAFVEIKGQKFHYFVLNLFQYAKKDKLRVWDKRYTQKELNYLRKRETGSAEKEKRHRKKAKRGRIRDLSLVVNTGGYYEGEKSLQKSKNPATQKEGPQPSSEDRENEGLPEM